MKERIGWGILGPGAIAHKFAKSLKYADHAYPAAVASRDPARAKAFAGEYGYARAYGSYQEMLLDSDVDIVYIATPHSEHMAHTLMCLSAGKAVLCEKPLAPNAEQAQKMAACARDKGLFLMEAMWTRFLPAVRQAVDWLRDGRIGTVRLLSADFGWSGEEDPASRLYDPALAGGMLLDIGVYPLSLASYILGPSPLRAAAHAIPASTGVDAQTSMLLEYERSTALLSCSGLSETSNCARIDGSRGHILLPQFWKAAQAHLVLNDGGRIDASLPYDALGYQFEAQEAMACMRRGVLESPVMPLDESVAILRTADDIRAQIGVKYPFE